MKHLLLACFHALCLAGLGYGLAVNRPPGRAQAQTGIEITAAPAPVYTFGQSLTFEISARSDAAFTTVTLFYRTPTDTFTAIKAATFTPGHSITATYTLDLATTPLPAFATVAYWWELRTAAAARLTTPPQEFVYRDTRFEWRQLSRTPLNLNWHAGDTAFGQTALDIAYAALGAVNQDFQVTLPDHLDIYIYTDQAEAWPALQSANRLWIDGRADPTRNLIFVTVAPDVEAERYLARDLPHELTHILIYHATGGRLDRIPAWLNEGLAVTYQTRPDPEALPLLTAAQQRQQLIPLSQLCGPFPGDSAQAQLAYAQSAAVVSYLRNTYGFAKIAALLQLYADGADCSDGVQAVLGLSLVQVEEAWRRDTFPGAQTAPLQPWLGLAGLLVLAGSLGAAFYFILPHRRARVV